MSQWVLFALCCVGAALLIAGNLWFYLRVLRPLHNLARQADQLTAGDLDAFTQPCGGIVEVQRLQRAMAGMCGHVRRAQQQSRAYTDRLADSLEHERQRIARELHDETVQSVIAITQALDLARSWAQTDPARAVALLTEARAQAVAVVARLRDLIGGLRPPALAELGLVAALRMQVDSVNLPAVQLRVEGTPRRLDDLRELALFRAAQEALTNIQRHSQAHQAALRLAYDDGGVTLHIHDDGSGFAPPPHLADFALQQRYGLMGIEERISGLGGRLTLMSQPGAGTHLSVYLPSDQPQPTDRVRDPVCSAWIAPQQAYGRVEYAGTTYYFCCPVCQGAFQKEPAAYIGAPPDAD